MADIKQFIPFLQSWEGGFVNHKNDKGGATNKGVTFATFQYHYGKDKTVDDLKAITDDQWMHIFKSGYWNICKADQIKSQAVANMLVDWTYNSGRHGIKYIQKVLYLASDGCVGPMTINAINKCDELTLFNTLKQGRELFFLNIVERDSTQSRFLKGWLRRLNSIYFDNLISNR